MKLLLARAYGHLLVLGLLAWALMSLLCGGLANMLVMVMPKAEAALWSSLAGLPLVLLLGWYGISRRALKQMHRYWGLLLLIFATVIWTSGTASYFRAELDTWSLPANAQLQLTAQSQREAGLDSAQLQTRTVAALPLVQQHLSNYAAKANTWYLQLPNARTAFFTLNWQTSDHKMYQQLLDRSGQPLTLISEVQWSEPPRALGTWFFQLHYTLLGALGGASRYIVALTALLLLWLSFSGLRLWLQQRRYAGELGGKPQSAAASMSVANSARWHIWTGLAAFPSLLLVSTSALITMLWQLNPSPLDSLYGKQHGAFYSEVLPWFGGGHAAVGSAPVVDIKQLLVKHANFSVGKIQVNQPGAVNSTVLFTQAAESQVSNQLAQVIYDRQGQIVQATAPNSITAMQLRSYWYGLHQALFAEPLLRVCFAFASALLVVMMWFGLRQWQSRNMLAWYWRAMLWTVLPGVPLVMLLMVAVLPWWPLISRASPELFPIQHLYHGQLLFGLVVCLLINGLRFRRQSIG
jgi:uncharacterized iron-regulated membrane protein